MYLHVFDDVLSSSAQTLYELFRDYSFLWEHDVTQTFNNFLKGKGSPVAMRGSSKNTSQMPSQHQRMLTSAQSASRSVRERKASYIYYLL